VWLKVQLYPFFNLALDGGGGRRLHPAVFHVGKNPTHYIGYWVGLRTVLDGYGKSRLQPGMGVSNPEPAAFHLGKSLPTT
jgi:hypothetical protein